MIKLEIHWQISPRVSGRGYGLLWLVGLVSSLMDISTTSVDRISSVSITDFGKVIGSVSTMLGQIYGKAYTGSSAVSNIRAITFVGTVVGQLIFGYTSDKVSSSARPKQGRRSNIACSGAAKTLSYCRLLSSLSLQL